MLLDTQYRMHPLIADYPSRQFYQGLLHSGIGAQDRRLPKGRLLPFSNFLFQTAAICPLTREVFYCAIVDETHESCGWPELPLMMYFARHLCLPHIKIRQVVDCGYL